MVVYLEDDLKVALKSIAILIGCYVCAAIIILEAHTLLLMCVAGYTIISGSTVVVRTADVFTSFLKGSLGWFCDVSYICFGVCFDELVGRSGDWVLKSKV